MPSSGIGRQKNELLLLNHTAVTLQKQMVRSTSYHVYNDICAFFSFFFVSSSGIGRDSTSYHTAATTTATAVSRQKEELLEQSHESHDRGGGGTY